MALETSAESPAPVRAISKALADWIGQLGSVWIEGQVAEFRGRPGARNQFFVLRDTDAEVSLKIVADAQLVGSVDPPLDEGQRIIVWARPEFWMGQGSLQLRAREIRAVGIGDLLASIERLKALLAAEGLFAPERKTPLPFIPRRIGLICGRASAAMRDVLINTEDRWPGMPFEVREVAVQGVQAVPEIVEALAELDAIPDIDVIVIARGGGSVEDLLPFSNETLIRAVSSARTPVVSAIGHEQDVPILDLVADLRASTPTDAAKRIVPNLGEELSLISDLESRARQALTNTIMRATDHIDDQRQRIHLALDRMLSTASLDVEHVTAQLRALSPAHTLERGYAIVSDSNGHIITSPAGASVGEELLIRVAAGTFGATKST